MTVAAGASAQGTGDGWAAIQTLRSGTPVHVALTSHKTVRCSFDSADQSSLVCHQRKAGAEHPLSIQREEIRSVRARNLLVSAIAGTAVGVGVGAGVGALVDSRIKNPNTTNNAKFTGGLARSGGLLGGLLGLATEFVPGKQLYRNAEAKRP